jgi:hypothetical protein
VSCTCRTAVWVLSHTTSVASPRSGQSTPALHGTSIQQILAQLLVSQLEFLEAVLLRFLAVDLELFMSLLQKNFEYLNHL